MSCLANSHQYWQHHWCRGALIRCAWDVPRCAFHAAPADAWRPSGVTYSANSAGEYKTERGHFSESSCAFLKTNMAFSITIILSQNFTTVHFILKSVQTQMLSKSASLSDPSFYSFNCFLTKNISNIYENKVPGNGVR